MTFDVIASGSTGNAVVINGEILIDCGVSMKKLRESGYIKDLKLVLLTHAHSDHFRAETVRALHKERPALRFGCCDWMVPHLLQAGVDKRLIDVLEIDMLNVYNIMLEIQPEMLLHDVPNCAFKIRIGDEWLFYATDTSTLNHIEAKDYEMYLIEANRTEAEFESAIAEKHARGEFAYETRAAANHLSQEQAFDWLARNAGTKSKYVFLHQHREAKNETDTV